MKLNKKGMELFDKWLGIWEKEAERLEAEEPTADTGWGCLENDSFEKTIDDYIGIAILGDDDGAIYHILDNYEPTEIYAFGYTADQVVEMMKQYFDIDEDDDLLFRDQKKKNALRVLRILREAQSNLLDAGFDFMDDNPRLEQALTLIGDVMDDVSREYDLPIMSEQ